MDYKKLYQFKCSRYNGKDTYDAWEWKSIHANLTEQCQKLKKNRWKIIWSWKNIWSNKFMKVLIDDGLRIQLGTGIGNYCLYLYKSLKIKIVMLN